MGCRIVRKYNLELCHFHHVNNLSAILEFQSTSEHHSTSFMLAYFYVKDDLSLDRERDEVLCIFIHCISHSV